jgi:suppressor of ftsI
MQVEGEALTPRTLPGALLRVDDLRGKVTGARTIVLSEGEVRGHDVFYVNGKPFDPNRVDTRVRLGAVEAWRCLSPLDGYYDTVNVPVRGEIKIIIPFTDSTDVGKFVYHSHLLSHEDKGMMATIEVTC